MKKLFFALLFAMLLSSCSEGKLDDNLYDGTGGISAEVNGGLVKPQFALLYSHRTCRFDVEEGGIRTFTVGFTNTINGVGMNVNVKAINIPEGNLSGKTFPLKTGEGEGSFIFKGNFDDPFLTDDTHKGYLHVSFHNDQLHFITGIFSYDCVNSEGNVVRITNGKYDMYY
ncbi:MAG TPA: hypothetical protein PLS51_06680 [Flavobacterium sp.]|jgi:hypothetical protein|nr:hypothetical protein [Flavobacterium sp.]HPJ10298.1 hypothetical protein [Flavobacterium sp.]